MATLISIQAADGSHGRRCDGVCHRAKPGSLCTCICGGEFHGIGHDAAAGVSWETLNAARERVRLADGEQVQLRIGA